MATPKGMGRGLGALMMDVVDTSSENTPYQLLPIQKVENNQNQPRKDFDDVELQALADSIARRAISHAACWRVSSSMRASFSCIFA